MGCSGAFNRFRLSHRIAPPFSVQQLLPRNQQAFLRRDEIRIVRLKVRHDYLDLAIEDFVRLSHRPS
jgi:hypothetical protein